MKPYEEIDFPNGFLRWIREDGEYVCRMTEEQMVKIKAIHESPYEAPRTWAGLTDDEPMQIWDGVIKYAPSEMRIKDFAQAIEAKLKEKNT